MKKLLLVLLFVLPLYAAEKPKVLIIYDMEGTSGIDNLAMARFGQPGYDEGRRSLTADVNAAVRGLKAGGAGTIWVVDGHGSGNRQEPDVPPAQLDPAASFSFQHSSFDPYIASMDPSSDAVVCIAMHARANTEGFLAQTYTPFMALRVNGIDFTETHIAAASAARFGIPVIMVSGDNVLEQQLRRDFPDIEYAMVKNSRSRVVTEPVSRAEADRRIQAAARSAMEKFLAGKYRPYYFGTPFEFEMTFPTSSAAESAVATGRATQGGPTSIKVQAPTFAEGYTSIMAATRSALTDVRLMLLILALKNDPQGKEFLARHQRLATQYWLEPDKSPDWLKEGSPAPKREKYWGAD